MKKESNGTKERMKMKTTNKLVSEDQKKQQKLQGED
jgi:hypothetical protein